MKLEDLDGEVYISDSLNERIRNLQSKYDKNKVLLGKNKLGTLKSLKISNHELELDVDVNIESQLIINSLGQEISITGISLPFVYITEVISLNVETSRCLVKAIHNT